MPDLDDLLESDETVPSLPNLDDCFSFNGEVQIGGSGGLNDVEFLIRFALPHDPQRWLAFCRGTADAMQQQSVRVVTYRS